jgi:hypothetical protein
MSLIAFQTALGRNVRVRKETRISCDDLDLSEQERRNLARIFNSSGFRATASIQRSWCESRAATGAQLTLSILPLAQRRELIREWVDGGGGTNSFFAVEAAAFLEFIAQRVPDPSHALSLCRLEQAVLRAEAVAAQFVAPDVALLDQRECMVRASPHAALVAIFAELEQLLAAIKRQGPVPPLSEPHMLLVAPGLPGLARPAGTADAALWRSLAEPQPVETLLRRGSELASIETLWAAGAIETAFHEATLRT